MATLPASSTRSQMAAADRSEKAASPKVSVLVQTYNHEAFIGRALDSVVAQEAPFAFEVLVSDDLSADGTREIVCALRA